jgi:hypothetical protein
MIDGGHHHRRLEAEDGVYETMDGAADARDRASRRIERRTRTVAGILGVHRRREGMTAIESYATRGVHPR